MHAKLAASSTTWTTGLAPLGHISWPNFTVFGGFRRVFDRWPAFVNESAVGSQWGDIQGLGCAERSRKSREAGRRSDRWDVESSGGRNFAHWWSYAREQPMHAKLAASSTTWTTGLAPLGHISWPKFRRFRWIPARFRSLARIRDESAVGSHGEIYRGWGARNGREKAGSWTGGRSSSQKGVQHEDFPGDMRALTFYALAAERQVGPSNLPGGVTLRTGGATPRAAYAREARRELHDVDNWACPVGPHFVAPNFAVFGWIPARFRSLAAFVMSRPCGLMGRYTGVGVRGTVEKKQEAGRVGGAVRKKGCNTRTSQGVTHPSTTLAQSTLNFGVLMGSGALVLRSDRWDVESSGGRNFAHWWSYAASSLCTRSSPRAPRRGQLGLPRWATFSWPKFRRFRWIPARFRSFGRIRDESAVEGLMEEIYRGWGARIRSRKSGKLDGWEEQFAKRGATRGLPRGSPILVLLSPKHA
ncbi:UNVERIFIED_CONTAM: hypothetical protein Sindi_2921200 [Sesamum indicum]